MLKLENDFLEATFSHKGAELKSLYHKKFDLHYLWNGDEAYWNRCSPVLFPIVGKVKDNTYTYKGQDYHLTQHGFARDTEFMLEEQGADRLVFSISSTTQTKSVYPFDFQLYIIYILVDSRLEVSYKLENKGNSEMLFSIGAHPGFRCPLEAGLNFEDYYLQFEKAETSPRMLVGEKGISRKTEPLFTTQQVIPLHVDLFGKKDAIIVKDLSSDYMLLKSDRGLRGLKFTFKGFPYMGIWTKPGPFICIEPWFGIADFEDADGKLENKEGICTLNPFQVFQATYAIELF